MIDSLTGERLTVHTEGDAGPYVMVDPTEVAKVADAFKASAIAYQTDSSAVSVDGVSVSTSFSFGTGANVDAIQQVLDSLE